MKAHLKLLGPILALIHCPAAQAPAQTKQQLRALYDSIIVDTRAFDHFKERWAISDPIIIREVFTQLRRRASAALAGDSLQFLLARIAPLTNNGLSEGLRLVCTKRYYDDEIESVEFQLVSQQQTRSLGALSDYVLVLDALGQETYELLRSRRYKDKFQDVKGTRYDIYLSPLESHIMLWATVPTVEWWRVFLYGKLGTDELVLPFWFKSSAVAALEVVYVDDVTVPDRNYSKFSIAAGVEAVNNFSVPGLDHASANAILKKRKLQGSGDAFFLRGTYTPAKRMNILGSLPNERLVILAEVSVALHEKSGYASNIPDTFFTVRNSIVLASRVRNVGLFQFATGVAWHDLHRIALYVAEKKGPGKVEPVQSHLLPFVEFGIAQEGSLLQYDIGASFHHDVTNGCGFLRFRSKLLLSNMVGLDLRYFKTYTPSRLPSWQYDNYILPSIVIRINL